MMDKEKLSLGIFWGNEIAREKRKRANLEVENNKLRYFVEYVAGIKLESPGSISEKLIITIQRAQKCLEEIKNGN